MAEPHVIVPVMADVHHATARTIDPDERAIVWPDLVAGYPMFEEYQAKTDRVIPLIRLEPRPAD